MADSHALDTETILFDSIELNLYSFFLSNVHCLTAICIVLIRMAVFICFWNQEAFQQRPRNKPFAQYQTVAQ